MYYLKQGREREQVYQENNTEDSRDSHLIGLHIS